jgi:hypothetical protein
MNPAGVRKQCSSGFFVSILLQLLAIKSLHVPETPSGTGHNSRQLPDE